MTQYLTVINSVAVLAGAVAVIILQYKSRKRDVSNEVISNYEKLERQLKEQREDLQKQLNTQATKHASEIAELHKLIGEKDAIIRMQETIIRDQKETIANRNPDLEMVLTEIKDFMRTIHDALQENREISTANSEELHDQTKILKSRKAVILTGEVAAAENIPTA
jgi:D-ribose pyranose/furanose isomerase RbsD